MRLAETRMSYALWRADVTDEARHERGVGLPRATAMGVRPPSRRSRFDEPRRSFSGGGWGEAPRLLT